MCGPGYIRTHWVDQAGLRLPPHHECLSAGNRCRPPPPGIKYEVLEYLSKTCLCVCERVPQGPGLLIRFFGVRTMTFVGLEVWLLGPNADSHGSSQPVSRLSCFSRPLRHALVTWWRSFLAGVTFLGAPFCRSGQWWAVACCSLVRVL